MYDHLENAHQILKAVRGKNSLWHRTSVPFLRQILQDKEIRPNNGSFEYSYPQSKNSLSQRLKGISLFDFDTRPLENIMNHDCKWVSFMHDKEPLTVLIRLNRDYLKHESLIYPWHDYESLKIASTADGTPYVPMHIPEVEVIHKGPIPIEAFLEYFLVKRLSDFSYITIDVTSDSIGIIESLYSAYLA